MIVFPVSVLGSWEVWSCTSEGNMAALVRFLHQKHVITELLMHSRKLVISTVTMSVM